MSSVHVDSPRAQADATESSSADVAIRAAGLWRAYGERIALEDVSFALPRGESLVVLGPNGAGKTTLLRVLATLLRPGGGEVSVLGCRLPRDAWRARGRIGFLGHEPLLYRDLTARENLAFCARLHAIERPGGRIDHLLERVGMGGRADERVAHLSAGMAQRVAACRAVLHEPELVLLDEPWTHLDPGARAMVEQLLDAPGRTRIAVTHDLSAGLGEGLVLMLGHGGRVAYSGPAAGLPASEAEAIYAGPPR